MSAAPLIRFATDQPAKRRLYCFPFAGGSAATYRTWPQSLPSGTEVAVLRFPGREPGSADAPLTSIEAMAAFAHTTILGDGALPFALFGHSMGAAVAYEVASALERSGGPAPQHLFVSARQAPGVLPDREPIHRLPDDQFVDAIEARYGGIPPVVRNEPDLLRMYMGILRADVTAFETYVQLTDHRLACPVTAFGGIDDTHPTPEQLAGWADVATGPVATHTFRGGHFYVNEQGAEITARMTTIWNPDLASA